MINIVLYLDLTNILVVCLTGMIHHVLKLENQLANLHQKEKCNSLSKVIQGHLELLGAFNAAVQSVKT